MLHQKTNTVNINEILEQLGYPQNITGQTALKSGVDYVAAMNSNFVRSNQNQTQKKEKFHDQIDLRNTKAIQEPPNQYGCSMCYLVAVLSSLEDRITIKTGRKCPFLSYTFVLSCDNKNQKCLSGNPIESAKFVSTIGTVEYACAGFGVCINNPGCAEGTNNAKQNNALIPECQLLETNCISCYGDYCTTTNEFVKRKKFFIDPKSIFELETIDEIKSDLCKNGTVPATFRVYLDFILGGIPKTKYPKADNFSQTGNIYINIAGEDIYDMGKINDTLVSDTLIGSHSVCIVGYDSKEIVFKGSRVTIPYWIIRNSWSQDWNLDGYVNVAMTNPALKINTRLGLDIPLTVQINNDIIRYGGCFSFLPDQKTLDFVRSMKYDTVEIDKKTCAYSLLQRSQQFPERGLIAINVTASIVLLSFVILFIVISKMKN